jgi:hypothetical protein
MDASEVSTRNSEWPRTAASRQKECVVRKHRTVVQPDATRNTRNFLDPATEVRLDRVLRVEVKRPQLQALPVQCACQVFLRQGRALIRQPRLVADHSQLPREAFAA